MRTCQGAYRLRLPEGANQSGVIQVCSCTWERITREIPVEDLEAFEDLPSTEQVTHPITAELKKYTMECTSQHEAPRQDPPPP